MVPLSQCSWCDVDKYSNQDGELTQEVEQQQHHDGCRGELLVVTARVNHVQRTELRVEWKVYYNILQKIGACYHVVFLYNF